MNTVSAIDNNRAFAIGNTGLFAINLTTHAEQWGIADTGFTAARRSWETRSTRSAAPRSAPKCRHRHARGDLQRRANAPRAAHRHRRRSHRRFLQQDIPRSPQRFPIAQHAFRRRTNQPGGQYVVHRQLQHSLCLPALWLSPLAVTVPANETEGMGRWRHDQHPGNPCRAT